MIEKIDKTLWGELEPEPEEEYEEEEEEEEMEQDEEEQEEQEQAEQQDEPIQDIPITDLSGLETPSGTKTELFAEHVPLRKDKREDQPKQLYTVLPQRETSIRGFMGSQHGYEVSRKKQVEVELNPEELEKGLDPETLKRKYNEKVEASLPVRQDLSDMVLEHAQNKKTKRDDKSKRHKEFKF